MDFVANTTWPRHEARAYIEERVVIVPWSGCWLWEGGVSNGYGQVNVPRRAAAGKRCLRAHRLAYEAFVGRVSACVLHKCDVRACCNPDHLFPGTHGDNTADMLRKGRGRALAGEQHPSAKITADVAREVLRLLARGMPQKEVARRLGVGRATVSDIGCRRGWKHLG